MQQSGLNYSASLLALIIYSFGVALASSVFASFFAPLLYALFFKKSPTTKMLKSLAILNIFVLFSVASVLLACNYELAGLIFVRSNLIMLFALALFSGIKQSELLDAFSAFNLGHKLNSLIFFTLNFISALRRDLSALKTTLKARGFVPRSDIFSYKTYANLLALLLIFAFKHLQNAQKTLLARNYGGFMISSARPKLKLKDYALLMLCAICVALRFGELI